MSRRLQSKSKSEQGLCCHTRGLTLPSRGRPPAGFARLRPPLTSNVRPRVAPHEMHLGRLARTDAFRNAMGSHFLTTCAPEMPRALLVTLTPYHVGSYVMPFNTGWVFFCSEADYQRFLPFLNSPPTSYTEFLALVAEFIRKGEEQSI